MDPSALLARILKAVDDRAYLTPTTSVDPGQRRSMERIKAMMHDPSVGAERIRAFIEDEHAQGRIDRVHMLSGLHVLAASPRVNDLSEAARLAGEQEQAALELGGPHLQANLASVSRHRGVLAFLSGHLEVALDHFTAAFERQRTPENVGNVLATLLRLGELDEAETLLAHIERSTNPSFVRDLHDRIDHDPDLSALRLPEVS